MYIGCRADFARCERGARHARRASGSSALKFKQARAYETDEIEAAHGNSGDTPWTETHTEKRPTVCVAWALGRHDPLFPATRWSRPACDISISIDETVGAALLGTEEYFMNFLQSPAGLYRCPCPAHQLCAGEFAWLITMRRVPGSVDRLNERWRMRP